MNLLTIRGRQCRSFTRTTLLCAGVLGLTDCNPAETFNALAAAQGALVAQFTSPPTEVYGGQSVSFAVGVSASGSLVNRPHIVLFSIPSVSDRAYASIDSLTGIVTGKLPIDVATKSIRITAFAVTSDVSDKTKNVDSSAVVSVSLLIRSRVTQVVASPASVTVNVGDKVPLTAVVGIVAGSPTTPAAVVTWVSSNPAAVTVDSRGTVTAVQPTLGQPVQITAAAEGVTGTPTLVVVSSPPTPADLQIVVTSTPSSGAVTVGGTRQYAVTLRDQNGTLIPSYVTPSRWSISVGSPSVADITQTGLATCRSAGTVTVSALGPANLQGSFLIANATLDCVATAGNAVAAILLTPWTVTTGVGGTTTILAKPVDAAGAPTTACTLGFAVDGSAVASVAMSGNTATLTGNAPGTTAVRAFCSNAQTIAAAARLAVTDPAYGVAMVKLATRFVSFPASSSASTFQWTATTVDGAGNTVPAGVTWAVQGGTAVTIDQTGKLTVSASTGPTFGGGATITATSYGQTEIGWATYGNAGTIRGQLISTAGQYVGTAIATATPVSGGSTVTTTVNNDGYFYLVGLAADTYTVILKPGGTQQTQTFQNVAVTAGQQTVLTVAPVASRIGGTIGTRP